QLTTLDLRANQISELSALSGLSQLTTLDLRANQISELSALSGLSQLTKLSLGSNQISELSALSGLSQLTTLYLSYNQISELSVLSGLSQLTTLYLSSNQISELSALSGLSQLTTLDLSSNQISELSALLDLIKKDISIKLTRDFDGKELVVGDNPLVIPPNEIIELGNQAVLDYFEALEKGTAYLNEAKLIIVGEPAAGKTSLMECLWSPQFELIPEADSKSTLGIEVREGWQFPHPEFKDINFTANIWDFGGQHIQYMTHQFFLTPNAVYLLVSANDRKESTNFPYWFKIINLLGQDDGRHSPVIVVLNEKNQLFPFDFDRSAIARHYPHIPLKVCEVNLDKAKRGAKFEVLKQTIQEALANLPLVKAVKPAAWIPIREALVKRAKREPHISFAAYERICKKHGVKERNQQLLFLRYLHRLGSLLYFEKDQVLFDFIILDPKWAVDAVYCVIADKSIADSHGYFKRSQLEAVWSSKKHKNGAPKYNLVEQSHLFNLMKKDNFEICYPLREQDNEYIIPQLLTVERPAYEWNDQQTLKFRYQYAFMPQGIIARLIVRLSHLLKQKNGCDLVWRRGMLLESKEKQCSALVQEDEIGSTKVIDIAISGNTHQRKYLLYDIRTALNELHQHWFSNIQVEEMIPCNCRECISKPNEAFYFKFKALKTAQEKGKLVKECDKSCIDMPILSLLEGIYQQEELRFMNQDKTGSIHISVGDNSQVNLGANSVQKQNSDNYTVTQTLSVEQRQQLSGLIKALRNMDLSDDDMDIVDNARQIIRADEKQATAQTQSKLASVYHKIKDLMDLSNNTIGVATAVVPVLPQIIEVFKQSFS
ncbi:MAG: hypothetical protein RLZZ215_493, partial [Pseudomonadota bacterium]